MPISVMPPAVAVRPCFGRYAIVQRCPCNHLWSVATWAVAVRLARSLPPGWESIRLISACRLGACIPFGSWPAATMAGCWQLQYAIISAAENRDSDVADAVRVCDAGLQIFPALRTLPRYGLAG